MGKVLTGIEDDEIRDAIDKIGRARRDLEAIRVVRKKCADAYNRMPLGNEVENRSQVTASSVLNHVEGIHPNLMKRYLATDHRITVVGPDPRVSQALKQWARERITDQGGFRLINDVLKDGCILSNGTAKLWWSRLWGKGISGEQIVTEEELARLTADPEWEITAATPLPRERAEYHDPGLGIDQLGMPFADPFTATVLGPQKYRIQATYTELMESSPVIVPVPPEEFICENGKVRINDRKACGHIRKMMAGELIRENERLSVPGMPYYSRLKEAIASSEIADTSYEDQERRDREAPLWDYATETDPNSYTTEELRKSVTIIEWASYMVVAGKLVPTILTLCNSTPIRVEENEDGIVPMCTWSPMVLSHSIYGYGVGWLHADEQNIQTVLTRAALDSVAFMIDKPRLIRQRSADLLGLQNLYPGKLVVGQEGDYKDIEVGVINEHVFKVIEFLKGEGEERGPGTRYNMGTDSDTLNATATGVSLIQRAALNKVDMIALAFSELFLVDLYNKLIFLAQHNLDKPVPVQVDGQEILLTREMIQGDYRARGDLGLDVDFDDRAFAKAEAMMNIAGRLGEKFPMLFTADVAREHMRRVYMAAGEKDINTLLPPLPPMFKGWYPGKEQLEAQVMMARQALDAAKQQGQLPMQPAEPGVPPGGPGGPRPGQEMKGRQPGAPSAAPGPAPGTGSGVPDAEPAGRDYVAGQDTSQPDETMMGGM